MKSSGVSQIMELFAAGRFDECLLRIREFRNQRRRDSETRLSDDALLDELELRKYEAFCHYSKGNREKAVQDLHILAKEMSVRFAPDSRSLVVLLLLVEDIIDEINELDLADSILDVVTKSEEVKRMIRSKCIHLLLILKKGDRSVADEARQVLKEINLIEDLSPSFLNELYRAELIGKDAIANCLDRIRRNYDEGDELFKSFLWVWDKSK